MTQLNMHMTPAFQNTLAQFMRTRRIKTKSEAVRVAVQEGVDRAIRDAAPADFNAWVGLGCGVAENPLPRFASDDPLWES